MLFPAIALSLALSAPHQDKTVNLNRIFAKGEKVQYSVESNLHWEERHYGLRTFMPGERDENYKFSAEVTDVKTEGVAHLHYLRPSETTIFAETFDRPAKTIVNKLDQSLDLTVSPINELLAEKDLNPPKKKPMKPDDGGDGGRINIRSLFARPVAGQVRPGGIFGMFIDKVYFLALNIGPLNSSLDFSPKLPVDDVKVGDTWSKTVNYEPQAVKGKDGKIAIQRLDYLYTYKGIVTVNGKQYHRINATLDLSTDLASFVNQLLEMKPDESGLKSIPLQLKQSVDYDLDLTTKRTISALSTAEGGFKVNFTELPEEPYMEQKFTGKTQMKLLALGLATTTPPKGGKGKGGRH